MVLHCLWGNVVDLTVNDLTDAICEMRKEQTEEKLVAANFVCLSWQKATRCVRRTSKKHLVFFPVPNGFLAVLSHDSMGTFGKLSGFDTVRFVRREFTCANMNVNLISEHNNFRVTRLVR
jgi:hypothetical protein